jgi:Phage capsid family
VSSDPNDGEGNPPFGASNIGRTLGPLPSGARGGWPPPQTPYPPRPYPPRGGWPPPQTPYPPRGDWPPPVQTPYPPRPYPPRPYPPRGECPDCTLDPCEWSADVAELFRTESALVRLGAPIVYDEDDLPIPAMEDQPPGEDTPGSETPEYVERPKKTKPESTDEPKLKKGAEKPAARVSERHLHPEHHELAVKVIIPNDLACKLAEYADVAQALKHDLARALALRADRAFLHGDGNLEPRGISKTGLVGGPIGDTDLLGLVREIVSTVRLRGINGRFGCAGWILHPNVLDALSGIFTNNGLTTAQVARGGVAPAGAWTLDAVTLLTHDGRDGGVLVGYPFIVTPAAQDGNATMLHFSSDWSEAWIAAHRQLVTVDVSTDVNFQTDETVIRAVMHHDFVLRRPKYFAYAQWPPQSARRRRS